MVAFVAVVNCVELNFLSLLYFSCLTGIKVKMLCSCYNDFGWFSFVCICFAFVYYCYLSFCFIIFFLVFVFLAISLAYPFPRLSVGAGYWRGILENANASSYCNLLLLLLFVCLFVCLWCEKERFNEKQRDYYLEQLQSIETKNVTNKAQT